MDVPLQTMDVLLHDEHDEDMSWEVDDKEKIEVKEDVEKMIEVYNHGKLVDKIEFADDEDEELPKPMTLEEVIRSL
jgi:hypothetical protein